MDRAGTRHIAIECEIDGERVVQLQSPEGTRASIATELGNNVYEFAANGKNAIWFPYSSPAEFSRDPDPEFCGTPFLAPWANRLDEHAFYANGSRFELDRELANYLTDDFGQPIHGILWRCPHWRVEALRSTPRFAEARCRLDFSEHPDLVAQFPFPHTIAMTHRLQGRRLNVRTEILNTGDSPMPVSCGFHPYFQLHDCDRDDWVARLGARTVWDLDDRFIPTGEQTPVGEVLGDPSNLRLQGQFLDHVLGGLRTGSDGVARFAVIGRRERVEVGYGDGYAGSSASSRCRASRMHST